MSEVERIANLESRVIELERLVNQLLKKGTKKVPTSSQALRVAAIFHRAPTTYWSPKEISTYKALGIIAEPDISLLEDYYNSDCGILRKDLSTFLNNFAGELDRARAWKRQGSQSQNGHYDPPPRRPASL